MWICFWAFYCIPLIYVCVFLPLLYCFDDCSFVVQSKVRVPDYSSSILLSQDCFGSSGSFVYPYKLKNFLFQFCEKCHWQFDRDGIESVYCLGWYSHFYNIDSSNPRTYLSIFIIFDFFHQCLIVFRVQVFCLFRQDFIPRYLIMF